MVFFMEVNKITTKMVDSRPARFNGRGERSPAGEQGASEHSEVRDW